MREISASALRLGQLPARSAAASPAAPAGPAVDTFRSTAGSRGQADRARAILDQATALPARPADPAAEKAWLMDGFCRLLKATAAEDVLRAEWGAGRLGGDAYMQAGDKVRDLELALKQSPLYPDAKREFFGALVAPAQAMIDSLNKLGPLPSTRAGKERWVAESKVRLAKARVAEGVLNDAWFKHEAIPFERVSAASGKIWNFEAKIAQVESQLHPQPRSRAPFSRTQEVGKMMNHPVSATVGAVVLPIVVTVDVLEALTAPFRILGGK